MNAEKIAPSGRSSSAAVRLSCSVGTQLKRGAVKLVADSNNLEVLTETRRGTRVQRNKVSHRALKHVWRGRTIDVSNVVITVPSIMSAGSACTRCQHGIHELVPEPKFEKAHLDQARGKRFATGSSHTIPRPPCSRSFRSRCKR